MELEEFETFVKGHAESRPVIAIQTRRIIRNRYQNQGDYLSDERFFLELVEKETGHTKATKSYDVNTKKRRSSESEKDAYQQVIKDWSRKKPKPTGDLGFAIATFYYFFRYIDEPSYFIEIAKKNWNIKSEIYKRFYYAKKGGAPDDSFEKITERFKAKDALVQYADIAVIDEILEPRLTIETSKSELHYSKTVVKVLGRVGEQKKLRSLLSDEAGFQWLQLAGVGGQGKSRLAFELVSKAPSTWYAGFLLGNDLAAFNAHWNEWQPTQPTLIVIDYILGREADVKQAFQALAKRSDELEVPVRMLLVERQRWDRGGLGKKLKSQTVEDLQFEFSIMPGRAEWFLALCNNTLDGSDTALSKTRFRDGVIELEPLSAGHLVTIARYMAEREGEKVTLQDETIKAHLARIDGSGRPLFAYFLGQAMGAGNFQADWDQKELLTDAIARDQNKRWSHSFSGEPPLVGEDTLAMRLAVLATMVEGIEIKSVNWPEGWSKFGRKTRREALALVDGDMGNDPRIVSIIPELQPDILGEWFVLSCLTEELDLQVFAQLAWSTAPNKMAAFLQRCALDFPAREEVFQLLEVQPNAVEGQNSYRSVSAIIVQGLMKSRCKVFPDQLIESIFLSANAKEILAMNTVGFMNFAGIGVIKNHHAAYKWWLRAAKEKSSHAMTSLSFCYGDGIGVDVDPVKMEKWSRKAAKAGDRVGMRNLAICYRDGNGVDADPELAAKWFLKAAKAGDGNGMRRIAISYRDGIGVDTDPIKAAEWFGKAAKAGDRVGMRNLAICYRDGIGVDADLLKAAEWFRKAAKEGDANGMRNLAICYRDGIGVAADPVKAAEWFRKSAETGQREGMVDIWLCYLDGSGVDADPVKGAEWLRKAAKAGERIGMCALGSIYKDGVGVNADPVKAVKWFRKAAEAGVSIGMHNLAICYRDGIGVDANPLIAAEWFRKETEVNERAEMLNLGVRYRDGTGVDADPVKAAEYFHKAAKAGDRVGMRNLAICYRDGIGVDIDPVKAAEWFLRSAEAGDGLGMIHLGVCYRNGLGVGADPVKAAKWFRKAKASSLL